MNPEKSLSDQDRPQKDSEARARILRNEATLA